RHEAAALPEARRHDASRHHGIGRADADGRRMVAIRGLTADMRISDIRPVLLTAPYGAPGARAGRRSACFVEVETDEGIIGLGETYAGMYVPELAAAIINWFKPLLVGSAFKSRAGDPGDPPRPVVQRKDSAREAVDALVQGLDGCNPELVYRLGYWVASSIGRTGLMVMVLSA